MIKNMNLASDDFTLLSLPQQYAIDLTVLHTQWKTIMAKTHPDRFIHSSANEQRLAMQWSMRINEAYQRLKNPLKRAEYLCHLRGIHINTENNTAMPAAFLMQQIEWREALEDAHNDIDKQRIKNELLAQADDYKNSIQIALDTNNDTNTAATSVLSWLFIDKLIKQI